MGVGRQFPSLHELLRGVDLLNPVRHGCSRGDGVRTDAESAQVCRERHRQCLHPGFRCSVVGRWSLEYSFRMTARSVDAGWILTCSNQDSPSRRQSAKQVIEASLNLAARPGEVTLVGCARPCYCSAIMSANCSGKMSVWSRGLCPRAPGVFKAWGIALDILLGGGWGGAKSSPDGYPSPPHPVIPRRVALQRCALPFRRTVLGYTVPPFNPTGRP